MNRLFLAPLFLIAVLAAPIAAQQRPDHDGPGGRERHGHGPRDDDAPRAPIPFAIDPAPSTYRPLPRADLLVTHAIVLDGAGKRWDDADVSVHDGRIVAIGRALDPAGYREVDAHGRWLTPGIIDVHSHNGTYVVPLTSIDAKSSDVTELGDPNAADTWIEHAINVQDPGFRRALAGGVTTLEILPGSSVLFGGRSVVLRNVPANTVQAMKFPGAQQGLKMACGENPKTEFGGGGRGPNSRQGEVALMRGAFDRARGYREEWANYESGRHPEPPRRDRKSDTLAAVLNGDIRVQMHCYRADDMGVMLNLAKEEGFRITAFHHAMEGYKIPTLLREAGTCAVVWSDWWGYKLEAADGIRENAAFLDAGGVCVAMHSDSPVLGQRLNVEAGVAAAAGRRAGLTLPPEHVIQWLTRNPARILGIDDRVGTIEPGKYADLVLWSGDPFSVYAHADDVWIDGALVYDRADPRMHPLSDFELGRSELPR